MAIAEFICGGQTMTAFGHEQVTIDATTGGKGFTAGTITPTTGNPASRAIFTVETAQIRFTYNGTAPTASVGHIAEIGDRILIEGITNVAAFRAIRTGAVSGVIDCTFERFI